MKHFYKTVKSQFFTSLSFFKRHDLKAYRVFMLSGILWIVSNTVAFSQDFTSFNNRDFDDNELQSELHAYYEEFDIRAALALGLSLGAVVEFGKKNNGSFRLFISGSILKNFSTERLKFMAALQSEVEFFRGGIGSSELKVQNSKFNIEWRNTPQILIGWNSNNTYRGRPLTPSLGQSMSVLYDPSDYSVSFGSIFVNGINHKRNQQLGFLQVGINSFQLSYINDGPPFHWGFLPLGDEFDRYWSGNLDVGFYWLEKENYLTNIGFRYTRFTGYEENIYELSEKIRVKNMLYKDTLIQFQNKGRYQYRFGFFNFGTVSVSAYQPKSTGLQEYLHYIFNYPFHPNTTDRYWTSGVEFNYRNTYYD